MEFQQGWIKLYRSILNNDIWNDNEPFDKRSAWIDILLNVSRKDHISIKNNKSVDYKQGMWITSLRELSTRWNRHIQTVRGWLTLYQELGMIEFSVTPKNTVIMAKNWGKYQVGAMGSVTESVTPTVTPSVTPSVTESVTAYTQESKEDNNVDDDNNYNQEVDKDTNNTSNISKIIIDSKSNINQDNNNNNGLTNNPFTAYEKNIGLLTPIIGEQLKDLVNEVGELKVLEAIRETALQGKRSYKYMEKVARNPISKNKDKKQTEENGKITNPFCPECNGTGKVIRYLDGDTEQPFEMKCPKCFANRTEGVRQ